MLIKNNKKLFEFKKFVTNRKKSLDDINRSISKSMIIENLVLEKKLCQIKVLINNVIYIY